LDASDVHWQIPATKRKGARSSKQLAALRDGWLNRVVVTSFNQ